MKKNRPLSIGRSIMGHSIMPWLAMVGVVLATAVVFWRARESSIARFHAEFEGDASLRANILIDAMGDRLMDLDALRRFYQSSSDVNRQEFGGFVGPVPNARPGVRAIAWVPRVRQAERAGEESRARRDGFTNFVFTERSAQGRFVAAGQREVYFPVFVVEPAEANAGILGLDLGAESVFRSALDQACDSGAPAATERLILPLDSPDMAGFLICVPVYHAGQRVETVDQRRAALQGFAVGMFRAHEVFRAALEPTPRQGLPIDFVDLSAPADKRLVYRWTPRL